MGYMQSVHLSDMFQGNCSKFWVFAALAAPSWFLKFLIMTLLSCQLSSMVLGNSDMLKPPHISWSYWRGGCVVLEQLWGDTPCPGAKEKSQKYGRKGEILFRIKPHTCQRYLEDSNIPCVHQNPETEPELCLSISWGGLGQQGAAAGAWALGAVYLGMI